MSSSFSSRGPPSLKDSCDTNVQVAFSEGRWAAVVTLAKNQFKRTRDPYYEVTILFLAMIPTLPRSSTFFLFCSASCVPEPSSLRELLGVELLLAELPGLAHSLHGEAASWGTADNPSV